MTAADILGGPLTEHLADRIPKAAKVAHERFPLVPTDDFEQAMWERVLAKPAKFRKLFEDERYGAIWEECRRQATATGKEDDRFRRAQKAAEAGYHAEDEEFYSTGMLAHLIPVLIEAEWRPEQAIERATKATDAAGVRIQSSEPGNAAETYMAILIDVCDAYARLREGERRLLATYYGLNQEDNSQGRWERQSLASSMGLTESGLRSKVSRALSRLQDELGGKSPWMREVEQEAA